MKTELTLKDIAILLDGVEVPDATAKRLAPFLRQDPRPSTLSRIAPVLLTITDPPDLNQLRLDD